jgi:hypothetical protein
MVLYFLQQQGNRCLRFLEYCVLAYGEAIFGSHGLNRSFLQLYETIFDLFDAWVARFVYMARQN